jgi:hypothetical protein
MTSKNTKESQVHKPKSPFEEKLASVHQNEAEAMHHEPSSTSILADMQRGGLQLTPDHIMSLQTTIGNQAVMRLLNAQSPPMPAAAIQRDPAAHSVKPAQPINGNQAVIQRNPIKDRLTGYVNDLTQTQSVNDLAAHLLAVINGIDAQQWDTVNNLLYSQAMVKRLKHKINFQTGYIDITGLNQTQIDIEVDKAVTKGMYWKDSKTLDLPEVALLPNNDFSQAITPQSDPQLAMKVYPVVLEEWTHMFQNMSGNLLSTSARVFAGSDEVAQNPQWSMHEMDIYAIYRDLGWASILDTFKARYPERQKYASWRDSMENLMAKQQNLSQNKRHGVRL